MSSIPTRSTVETSLPAATPSTRPATLALRSWLAGGPAPGFSSEGGARPITVLELGAGEGENLIPLAFYDRAGRYVGLEADAGRLEAARARAASVGLDNVRFEAAVPEDAAGEFDFIVVRGAFASAADDERATILDLVAHLLAPEGLCYIDYPVLPGAGVDAMVGELIRALVGPGEGATVEGARAAAVSLSEVIARPSHPYPNLLAVELAQVAALPGPEVERRYGVARARPERGLFHREMVELMAHRGLRFVGDAEREESGVLGALREELAQRGASGIALEQAVDVLCYRRSRASLFCRAEVEAAPPPGLDALDRLFIASPLSPASDPPRLGPGVEESFTGPDGARIGSVDPLLKASILVLHGAWPRPMSFAALMGAAVERLHKDGAEGDPGDELVAGVARDLWTLYARGLLELHLQEAPAASEGQRLHALARGEAEAGAALTTPYHTPLVLQGFDAALVRSLALLSEEDGARGDDALVGALMSRILSGEVPLELGGQRIADPMLLEPIVRALLRRGLTMLGRFGLLA